MKISIITVTFNSITTIQDTFKSVAQQTYNDFQHIIIDGVSNDGTIEFLQEYKGHEIEFISEPDKGLYDAMNKGIKKASGDVIAILNSDDVFYNCDTLELLAGQFLSSEVDVVFGDIIFFKGDQQNIVREWCTSEMPLRGFAYGWHPPHPGVFIRRELYDRLGVFDSKIGISADFDLLLRFFSDTNTKAKYISGPPLVKMRLGGESTKSLMSIIRGFYSIAKSLKKNKIKVNIISYFIRRYYFKLTQYR